MSMSLQLARTAHQLRHRREGVSILGDIAPSPEAFFLSLQLLDTSHRRWSSLNACASLEFGDIHSLAAAAFVTRKLLPGRDHSTRFHSYRGPGPGPPQPVRTLPGCSQLLQPVSTDFGPTTPWRFTRPGLFRKSLQLNACLKRV